MRLDGLHIAPQELPFLNVPDGVNLGIYYFAFRLWVCPKGRKGSHTHTSNPLSPSSPGGPGVQTSHVRIGRWTCQQDRAVIFSLFHLMAHINH